MGDIFRNYTKHTKGNIGIYSELSDHLYNIVQEKLIDMYSNDNQIEVTMSPQDIETEVEAVKQISFYHIRESIFSGINETYNNIKNKIYFLKLRELI